MDFIICFRGLIYVETSDGEVRSAAQWLSSGGRVVKLSNVKVTSDRTPMAAVVGVRA
jgi:hypothetical protein